MVYDLPDGSHTNIICRKGRKKYVPFVIPSMIRILRPARAIHINPKTAVTTLELL
jgi:hypothetical protein